jgi:hypothetical protein
LLVLALLLPDFAGAFEHAGDTALRSPAAAELIAADSSQ